MSDEYIRKADAVEAIGEEYVPRTDFERGMVSQLSCDKAKIKALSSADVVQVVHAHWKDNKNGTVSCSRCSTWFQKEREPYLRFCGYCGAKMDA